MHDPQKEFGAAKFAIKDKQYLEAYRRLAAAVSPDDDFVVHAKAAKLMARIPAMELGLKPLKIAVLASSTVDHFVDILKYYLARDGFATEIWLAPFDTIATSILTVTSELYSFRPDIVWIFTTARDVIIDADNEDTLQPAVLQAVNNLDALWQTVLSRLDCVVLQNNADIPMVDSLGNFAGQARWSRRNILRLYNLKLAAAAPSGVILMDLEHISSVFGKARWMDAQYWYHSKHPFNLDACGILASQAARIIVAIKGQSRKCLIVDLDNTMWGGVIGDDGLGGIKLGDGADGEAFVDFQRYLRSLKDRGVILAVCSKNDEENAKEPFLRHPDIQLKLEDFAVFRANWNNKADNIRNIAAVLDIGLDSLVFIDDNPVERDLVRQFLPMIAVPELPVDPAEYINAIERHHYFETISFSKEDRERTRYYRENAERSDLRNNFANISDYLHSLNMTAEVGDLDAFHLSRMAQLINKSNQFHLTGTRYTEADLQKFARRPDCAVRYFTLRDRFGNNGLISVVVMTVDPEENLVINTWVMSCRVLGRTMEEFICNNIIATARERECRAVVGSYVPSAKNKLVADLYQRLGFKKILEVANTTTWRLVLDEMPSPCVSYIEAVL